MHKTTFCISTLLLLLMAACVPAPQPSPTMTSHPTQAPTESMPGVAATVPSPLTEAHLSPAEQANIYEVVIRQLTGPDDTFGGQLEKPVIYIIMSTNDALGDSRLASAPSHSIDETIQELIIEQLNDLPSEIKWVRERSEVPLDSQTQEILGGGVILTLGNFLQDNSGKLYVAGSIYVANQAGGGQTYVLEQQDGKWVIIGNTGMTWIS